VRLFKAFWLSRLEWRRWRRSTPGSRAK